MQGLQDFLFCQKWLSKRQVSFHGNKFLKMVVMVTDPRNICHGNGPKRNETKERKRTDTMT